MVKAVHREQYLLIDTDVNGQELKFPAAQEYVVSLEQGVWDELHSVHSNGYL